MQVLATQDLQQKGGSLTMRCQAWFAQAKQDLAGLPPGTRIFVLAMLAAGVTEAVILATIML